MAVIPIKTGTVITFTVKGVSGWFPSSVSDVRGWVIDALTPFVDVIDVSFTTSTILNDPVHAIDSWPYTASVKLKTRVDYGDIRDLDSIVAHAFYDATSHLPTVTADGYETKQGNDKQTGFSITSVLILAAVALVAIAVIKVE